MSEGVDFSHHYGRCVVVIGLPFQYTKSPMLLQRLAYMKETHNIRESDYLTFDAIRQASQVSTLFSLFSFPSFSSLLSAWVVSSVPSLTTA